MLSIGEFSKATGLSIKALRLYHERGILVPSIVDRSSGYRYYDVDNVEQARVVASLRQMMLPLDQIADLLHGTSDKGDGLSFLRSHRSQLESKIREMEHATSTLDQLIREEEENRSSLERAEYGIEETALAPVLVAGIRIRGRYIDSGRVFGRLSRECGRTITGKPMTLFYDSEYKEADADFECCFPVKRAPRAEGIHCRELQGGRAVTLRHRGPYKQLGRAYASVFSYVNEHGYASRCPSREVYVKGPGVLFKGNPRTYVTEIQFLVDVP